MRQALHQALLFVGGLLALFMVAPLAVLLGTGRWRGMLEAMKGQALWWGIVAAFMVVGALVGWLAAMQT